MVKTLLLLLLPIQLLAQWNTACLPVAYGNDDIEATKGYLEVAWLKHDSLIYVVPVALGIEGSKERFDATMLVRMSPHDEGDDDLIVLMLDVPEMTDKKVMVVYEKSVRYLFAYDIGVPYPSGYLDDRLLYNYFYKITF